MRRVMMICFIYVTFLLLTGCWDRRETNDLAIIIGVGLDKTKEGKIEITVEVHSPRSGGNGSDEKGGGGNQGGGNKTILRTGVGVTLSDAIENLDEKLPREILWSHAEAIVISKAFAESGIREQLDFFVRHPEPRLRSYVFISEGNAKEIMALHPPLERSISELLIKLANSEVLMKVTLFDLIEMLKGESGASILPMIAKLTPEVGQPQNESIAYINRSAILKQGKMIGFINDEMTRGVLWFRNEIGETVVTVKPKESDGFVSMNLIKGRTELIPEIDGSHLKMTVKIITMDDVIQNESNLDLKKTEKINMLETVLAETIEMRLTNTLEKLQKEMKADVIGFAEEFRQKHPKKWKEIKEDWEERFPSVEVSFDIEADVLRTGKGSLSKKR